NRSDPGSQPELCWRRVPDRHARRGPVCRRVRAGWPHGDRPGRDGERDGRGELTINADGTVTIAAGAVIANTSGASGSSIELSGAGSQLSVTGSLIVG